MMRTGYILNNRKGLIVSAVVYHCDGRPYGLEPDADGHWSPGSGNLHDALQIAAARLEASHLGMPAPIINRKTWHDIVVDDRRVKLTANRVATVIAHARPGQWVGLVPIGNRLSIDFRNVARAIDHLVELGYLTRTHKGNRAFYTLTLPVGV